MFQERFKLQLDSYYARSESELLSAIASVQSSVGNMSVEEARILLIAETEPDYKGSVDRISITPNVQMEFTQTFQVNRKSIRL